MPLSQARRIIAERMVESKHTAPHAWSMVEVDVTDVWQWRLREKDRFERETGYRLTLLPFFVRAVVQSLAAFPLMNAKFVAASASSQAGIYVNPEVNVGIAIGLPTNLVVPVIRHADKLSIKGLAIAAGELIEKARKGKLGVDDLAGGTFTVNNNGANGSWASAPIINGGQAGIVTMEAIVKKLVVRQRRHDRDQADDERLSLTRPSRRRRVRRKRIPRRPQAAPRVDGTARRTLSADSQAFPL